MKSISFLFIFTFSVLLGSIGFSQINYTYQIEWKDNHKSSWLGFLEMTSCPNTSIVYSKKIHNRNYGLLLRNDKIISWKDIELISFNGRSESPNDFYLTINLLNGEVEEGFLSVCNIETREDNENGRNGVSTFISSDQINKIRIIIFRQY